MEIVTEEVPDDWADRWRAFHKPVRIGDRLHVRPPWEPPSADGLLEIAIDPGQAFGTGGHDTTRLCLELLLDLEPGGAFADLGCGSGVLAIAAAKLGWSPVLGVDHEAESVEATRENARVNGVEVSASRADLRAAPAPTAPTVAANLLRPLLLAVARAGLRRGGAARARGERAPAATRPTRSRPPSRRRTTSPSAGGSAQGTGPRCSSSGTASGRGGRCRRRPRSAPCGPPR